MDDQLKVMMALASHAGCSLQDIQRAFGKLSSDELLTLQSIVTARTRAALREGR